tara:strand:+ start:435 stop:662 length:228 start_codon:yes stop_codon:yes gene_type:complete
MASASLISSYTQQSKAKQSKARRIFNEARAKEWVSIVVDASVCSIHRQHQQWSIILVFHPQDVKKTQKRQKKANH